MIFNMRPLVMTHLRTDVFGERGGFTRETRLVTVVLVEEAEERNSQKREKNVLLGRSHGHRCLHQPYLAG